MEVTVRPYGPTAMLLELADTVSTISVAGQLRGWQSSGRIVSDEIVPGARTVLVQCRNPVALAAVRAELDGLVDAAPETSLEPIIEVPVVYDGPDLDDVARRAGIAVDDVVRLHTATTYTAAFNGFAPGFTYLAGLDPSLHLPRLDSPRSRVPAGSVGIGGEFTGVYPTSSPGGWRLLGSTDVVMWDLARPVPALLPPGRRVRFVVASR